MKNIAEIAAVQSPLLDLSVVILEANRLDIGKGHVGNFVQLLVRKRVFSSEPLAWDWEWASRHRQQYHLLPSEQEIGNMNLKICHNRQILAQKHLTSSPTRVMNVAGLRWRRKQDDPSVSW